MIRVACPCATAWRVKDALSGKRIHCPICGRIVTVPGKLRQTAGKKAAAKARPSLPPNIWYVQTSRGEIGPMHIVQIARAAWMGKINRSTRLRRSGADVDILAGDLAGIFPDEPADQSKPASPEDLTDWLAEMAEQASQGDAPTTDDDSEGALAALQAARHGGADQGDVKEPQPKSPPRGAAAGSGPRPKAKSGAKGVKPASQPDATGPLDPPHIWYIQTPKGELGPIHIVQVAKAAWMGKINRSTHLRRSGSDSAIPAGDLAGIFPDAPAPKSKPAPMGELTDDLTDYLAELAEQASQDDAPLAEDKSGGTLTALLAAQRSGADEPGETDKSQPPPATAGRRGRKAAKKKAAAKKKTSRKASRKRAAAKTGAGAKAKAGKTSGPKGPAADKKPPPPPEEPPQKKPPSKAAARRAALKALADTLSGKEAPDVAQIEAVGAAQAQPKAPQEAPPDSSAAQSGARAHWDRLTALSLTPETSAKTSAILLGAAMLMTIFIPWGVKDGTFLMSWGVLQQAEAGPMLLLVGIWVVGLGAVLAGVLLRRLTLVWSCLALSAIALAVVLLSGEGMRQLAPWLATAQPLLRRVLLGTAGLLLMVQMVATGIRLRVADSPPARLTQGLLAGGMAIVATAALVLLILDYAALKQGPRTDMFYDFLFFLMLWICLLIAGVLAAMQAFLRTAPSSCGRVSLGLGYLAVFATIAYVICRPAQKADAAALALSGVNVCLLVAAPWWLGKFALRGIATGPAISDCANGASFAPKAFGATEGNPCGCNDTRGSNEPPLNNRR